MEFRKNSYIFANQFKTCIMVEFDKLEVINEIKEFLEGNNPRFKYLVNVEATNYTNKAFCFFSYPNQEVSVEEVEYVPFLYIKNFKNIEPKYFDNPEQKFYKGDQGLLKLKMEYHGITIEKLIDGDQERLKNGYCYIVKSTKSFNSIINFFKEGGIDPYSKKKHKGKLVKDLYGKDILKNRELFFYMKPCEQFLIYHQTRLFNGIEDYSELRKLYFDIETRGINALNPIMSRVFLIGVRCNYNNNYETILEADDNDLSETALIQTFFNLINVLKPTVIIGHNVFDFDLQFIFKRAELLGMNLDNIPTGFENKRKYKIIPNSVVKIGSGIQRYIATEMFGYQIIDTLHSSKKQQVLNADMKYTNLKYVCKFEKVAKDNRMYIAGENIGKYWNNSNVFMINPETNEYIEIPLKYQEIGKKLYEIQSLKSNLEEYKEKRNSILNNEAGLSYVKWFKEFALPTNKIEFIIGKNIVRQYLLDDLYETEQIDNIYNSAPFLMAKMLPITLSKACVMGTASGWNDVLTNYSYSKGLAIPYGVKKESFGGGYARTFLIGFLLNIVKLDFSGLYPNLELSEDIFPLFDVSGVMKKILTYTTTVRDIFKHLSNNDLLKLEEVEVLKGIDHVIYDKYINNSLSDKERKKFKVKQSPLKVFNNSLFGALGSSSFLWSDHRCAARITSCGRLALRKALRYFSKFGLLPHLMVTDGINLSVNDLSDIKFNNDGEEILTTKLPIEEVWQYNNKKGLEALVEKFNEEELHGSMGIDLEDKFLSGINLARINYALLAEEKDKKTGEMVKKVKLKGSTIKSRVMSEYLEDFVNKFLRLLLENKPEIAIQYYNDYVEDMFYKRFPLLKIATKAKVKNSIKDYLKRGNDKNGRKKGVQAHMELIIEDRNREAKKIFEERFNELCPNSEKNIEDYSIEEIYDKVEVYMPKEPEIDTTIIYYNNGLLPADADSKKIIDPQTGEERFAAVLLNSEDIENNPNLIGDFNYGKYIKALNQRIWHYSKKWNMWTGLLTGFNPEIRDKIIRKIVKIKYKNIETGEKITKLQLEERPIFTKDELKLDAYELDSFEDCFYLEPKEVAFWERYGYDPNKIFDGFKTREDCRILPIYDDALNYLNGIMKSNNKPIIKRVDDDLNDGDYVLLKDKNVFDIGLKENGYIRIIKPNVNIPKSEEELENEKKHQLELQRLAKLKPADYEESQEETEEERLERFFILFLEKMKVPGQPKLEEILEIEEAKSMWEEFLEDQTYKEEHPDEVFEEEEEDQ